MPVNQYQSFGGGLPVDKKLEKEKIRLLTRHPFFGSILLNLPLVETKRIKGIGSDGSSIFYNPEYINTLSDKETAWVLARTMLHGVLLHIPRRGSRDK